MKSEVTRRPRLSLVDPVADKVRAYERSTIISITYEERCIYVETDTGTSATWATTEEVATAREMITAWLARDDGSGLRLEFTE